MKIEFDEMFYAELREKVLEGADWDDLAAHFDVSKSTLQKYYKQNTEGFADKYLMYKHERMVQAGEKNLENYLRFDTINTGVTKQGEEFTFRDPRLERIKLDSTVFTLETLGKKHYAKRNEVTGADGKDFGVIQLPPKPTTNAPLPPPDEEFEI